MSKSIYIPRGINTSALDRSLKWDFSPAEFKVWLLLTVAVCTLPCFQVGDHVSGGDIFGKVWENSLVDSHKITLHPRALGTITNIAEKGSYSVDVCLISGSLHPSGQTAVRCLGYRPRDRV